MKDYSTVFACKSSSSLLSYARRVMGDLGVSAREYGAKVTEGVAQSQLEEAILRYESMKQDSGVSCRFSMGDLYRALAKRYGARREFAIEHFGKERGEKFYNELRSYGWIAGKWPESKRSGKYPWSWYKNHRPDETVNGGVVPEKKKEHVIGTASEIERVYLDDGSVRFLLDIGGGKRVVFVQTPQSLRVVEEEGGVAA